MVPVALILWLASFTSFIYKDKRKIILIAAAIYGVLYEIFLIYSLATDYNRIGRLEGPVFAVYTPIPLIYLISVDLIFLITGIIFARRSIKSENPEAQLKGKILIVAIISFSIGAALDLSLIHI